MVTKPDPASEILLTLIVKLEWKGLGPTARQDRKRTHEREHYNTMRIRWLVSVRHERAKQNEPRIGHYPNVELLPPSERERASDLPLFWTRSTGPANRRKWRKKEN